MTVRVGRTWRCAAFLLSCSLIAGCGADAPERVETHPTRGSVRHQGKPAEGALVMLHPLSTADAKAASLRPNGRVAADGTYNLTTYEQADGAPIGEYAVTLYWPDETFRPRTPEEAEAAMTGDKPDRLRGRFRDPGKSPWKVTISEGPNEIPPLAVP